MSFRVLLFIVGEAMHETIFVSPNSDSEIGSMLGDIPKAGGSGPSYRFNMIYRLCKLWIVYLYLLDILFLDTRISFGELLMFTLMICGWGLRICSFRELGKYFTYNLGIRADHKLVMTGPYKYLVHPSYTGMVIFFISYALFLGKFMWIALPLALFLSYRLPKRIQDEELMMKEKFGDAYSKFLITRDRFIPRVY
jgi:protein-S-isoprenylcysteine O-methyltransferase Ste14